MKIEQAIDVPAPIERVWAFFDDVPRVASCMPGATLTSIIDDKTFDGDVAIKVGPVGVKYQGRLVIEEKDAASHTVRLNANGKDRKGAGSARAAIVATLTAVGERQTRLMVDSDVQLTGRIASLGRGVQDVAGKIFAQFGERMSAEITSDEQASETATAPSDTAPSDTVPSDTVPSDTVPSDAATPLPALVQRNKPIGAGSLLWSILKDKLARLFRRGRGRT